MDEKIKFSRPVPPFVRYCAATIPTMFDDSLSYYEALCALNRFIQKNIVEVINNNAAFSVELQKQFVELKEFVDHYFDNLDVQEEINNKLDEMAEDGTLQEIIAAYLNASAIWGFNTVADMKAATNLIDGSYAKTLGYYEAGDGGGSIYLISESEATADDATVIALESGLKAILQPSATYNVKQFGAKGDNINNDSSAFNKAISYVSEKKSTLFGNAGDIYKLSDYVYLKSDVELNLNGAEIRGVMLLSDLESVCNAGYTGISNVKVLNGKFNGTTQIILYHANNIKFENILFENAVKNGHLFDLGGCKNITIKNCEVYGNKREDNYSREVIQLDYATSAGQPIWAELQPNTVYDGIPTDGVTIEKCYFHKKEAETYYLNPIGNHSSNGSNILNVTIKECSFDGWFRNAIRFVKVKGLLVESCKFNPSVMQASQIYINSAIELVADSADGDAVIAGDIVIKNNTMISGDSNYDKYFIKIDEYDNTYATTNILVEGNYYSGSSALADFIQLGNVKNITIRNNIVPDCHHFINKTNNKYVTNICINDNQVSDFTGFIRSSTSDSAGYYTPDVFNEFNNILTKTISDAVTNINTSSFVTTCSKSVNSTFSNATDTAIPFDTVSNKTISVNNDELQLNRMIRNFKVGGKITLKSSSGTLKRITLKVWDMLESTTAASVAIRCESVPITQWTVIDLPELYVQDKSFKSRSSEGERYSITCLISCTGDVEINKSDTSIIVSNL